MRKCDVCGKRNPDTIYVVDLENGEVQNCCTDCCDEKDKIIHVIEQDEGEEVKIWNENCVGAGMVAPINAPEDDTTEYSVSEVPFLKKMMRKYIRTKGGSSFLYHSYKNALEYLEGEIRNIRTA